MSMDDFQTQVTQSYNNIIQKKNGRVLSENDRFDLFLKTQKPIINVHVNQAISVFFFNDLDYNKRRYYMINKHSIVYHIAKALFRKGKIGAIEEQYFLNKFPKGNTVLDDEKKGAFIKKISAGLVKEINERVINIPLNVVEDVTNTIYSLLMTYLTSSPENDVISEKFSSTITAHVSPEELDKLNPLQKKNKGIEVIKQGFEVFGKWMQSHTDYNKNSKPEFLNKIQNFTIEFLINGKRQEAPRSNQNLDEQNKNEVGKITQVLTNLFESDIKPYVVDDDNSQTQVHFDQFKKSIPQIQTDLSITYFKKKKSPTSDITEIIIEAQKFYEKFIDMYKDDEEIKQYFELIIKKILQYRDGSQIQENLFTDVDGEEKEIEDPIYVVNSIVKSVEKPEM